MGEIQYERDYQSLTENDLAELREWEQVAEQEYNQTFDSVSNWFQYRSFKSKSKGRNRKRKTPVIIELVRTLFENGEKWHLFDNLQWDTIAQEWTSTNGFVADVWDSHLGCYISIEDYLKERIRKLC